MVGFGPCYHMVNVLGDLPQAALWDRALDGEAPWAELFDGYSSTVDWPGGYFYAQLLEAHPDAKVLLSVRDAERWEPSFRETIVDMCFGDTLIHLLASARAHVDPKWKRYLEFVDRMFWSELGTFPDGHSREALIEGFNAHNERVKQVVPEERLLVWEVTDGWEPLCEFLEVPVPSEPVPHINDTASFLEGVLGGGLAALNAWWEQREQPGATGLHGAPAG
jgi:hypothetical protein